MKKIKSRAELEAFTSRLANLLSEADGVADDAIKELGDGEDQYFERCFAIIDDWKKRLEK